MKYLIAILFFFTWFNTGCGPSLLETSDLEWATSDFSIAKDAKVLDTEENRAILKTVYTYQEAMNHRDIETLRSLVSKNYYENASTTQDTSDDYGNESIEDILAKFFEMTQEVRLIIHVHRIQRDGPKAYVDYDYQSAFRVLSKGRNIWKSDRDVNRLTLVWEDNQWKIASGM